jgi:hypothetical protein
MSDQSNRLSFEQKIRIFEWFKENRTKIEEKRPTYLEAAAMAEASTGISVSKATVSTIAKSGALGYEWPKSVASNAQHLKKTLRYAALCSKVASLEQRIQSLEDQLGVK